MSTRLSGLDAIIAFERELQAYGLAWKGTAVCDGEIHRCDDVHHHRKRNGAGWYRARILSSGLLYGEGGSWFRGGDKFTWNSRGETRFTVADRTEIEKAKADRVAEEARLHQQAAEIAAREWARATPCNTHPYLERKHVKSHGLRADAVGRLLITIHDLDGNLKSLQRIDAAGDKKYLYGTDRNQTCHVIGDLEGATAIVVVEGYATGATTFEPTGWPTVVAFDAGGMKRIARALRERFPQATLIFAGDHDAEKKGGTGQQAARAAATAAGGVVALPPIEGTDWNDHAVGKPGICDAHGLGDVRRRLEDAAGLYVMPPTVSLDEGERLQRAAIDQFEGRAMAWHGLPDEEREQVPPPASLLNSTMGGGKSRDARGAAARLLKAEPHSAVSTFVQLHKLAQAQGEAFADEANMPASIWRGMSQPDPDRPGELMCLEPKLSEAAQNAAIAVSEICKLCPRRNECGYQRQRQQDWRYSLLPHQMLFTSKPAEIPRPTFVVVDEDFYGAGLVENVRLARSSIEGDLSDVPHTGDRELLKASRSALLSAIARCMPAKGMAYLTRETLTEAAISAETAREAARIEWMRKPNAKDLPLTDGDVPGMVRFLETLAGRFSPKVPLLWRLVAELLEGEGDHAPRIELEGDAKLRGGDGFGPMLWLHYRREIGEGWKAPTLILDGTAKPEIIRHFFPQLDAITQIDIEAPHQQVTWVRHSFAKARLVTSEKASARRNVARQNNVEDVRRYIEAKAAQYRGQARYDSPDVFVVCNQAVEIALRADPGLPGNVVIDHFNNTRGRNDWEHVRAIIVIGRTLPDARAIQRQAERLAAKPLAADDPLVTAVRWSICEAGLLQDIARGRGIRRKWGNPLDVFLLSDVPLPLKVDRVQSWAEAQPHPLDLMAARGIVPDCGSDCRGYWPLVAEVLPDLFSTVQAAKDAARGSRWNLSMSIITLDKSHCESAKARPPGSRYAVPVLIDVRQRDWLSLEILPPDRPPDFDPDSPAAALAPSLDRAEAPAVEPPAATMPVYTRDQLAQVQAPRPPPAETPPGLDAPLAPIGADLTAAFTISATATWPDATADNISPAWRDYAGGIMPAELAGFVRKWWPRAGLTQQQLADRAGISRPQLANALLGRFGLSKDAADRLRRAVAGEIR